MEKSSVYTACLVILLLLGTMALFVIFSFGSKIHP